MNQQQVRNYVAVKSFDTLRELGKVKGRTDFSRFYFGRNADYFSMILRSGRRLISLGALHRLAKRLESEIENEKSYQIKNKLDECVTSLQIEITTRLDKQASLHRSEKME
jgi:hypothetical protein